MSEREALIDRIAALVGIAPAYRDAFGHQVETKPETYRAILVAFGLPAEREDEARDSLARIERLRRGPVPALVPVDTGRPAFMKVHSAWVLMGLRVLEVSVTVTCQ